MRQAVQIDIDLTGFARAVGGDTHARGADHLRRHGVEQALWNATRRSLVGTVRGSRGDLYSTTAQFSAHPVLRFEEGQCICPVGRNCKHVVALVLSVTGIDQGRALARQPQPWERSLESLLAPAAAAVPSSGSPAPLAIELTPVPQTSSTRAYADQPAHRLLARVVRPGRNGWVAGDLSWSGLSMLHLYGDYVAEHVRLLQDVYAAYGARATHASYTYYGYQGEKTIELSGFESGQLWHLLDEAQEVGLPLVHSRASLGKVQRDMHAELCLDANRAGDFMALTPVVVVEGVATDAAPVVFIGTQAHGLVYVDRAEMTRTDNPREWALHIAKLAKPVSKPMQRLALDRTALRIPAGEASRFRDEFYPRLRHLAAVISTDESFTPPAISDPTLVLRASYGAAHELDLNWEWAYQVGDSQLRAPLHPAGDAGFRDLDAERAAVRRLDVGLERFGLRGADPVRGLVDQVALHGVETLWFSQEMLPLLDGHPGVTVEVSGEPADYREAGDSLRIGISTDETTRETDWFDLGVSIKVEGRDVPFVDVFTALTRDDSHLLLPDGAYFSLEKPELQALRRLIDEARALQERPDGPLRISRYQVGLWDELAELGVVDRQAQAWLRQIEGLRALESVAAKPRPEGLAARLRPYQADGFGWLSFLWEHGLGGILADDMGLGKTVQSLALICHAKKANPDLAPFLIVAPTSVVPNWALEAARFAPGLRVVTISDTERRRGQMLDETVRDADVVVTSYTLFRLDADAYSQREWSGLFLDEAQFVKNHQSKAYQCVRRLPAPFKLAITGTPMENNLMELWSLLSITAPGLFPNPTRFREFYARPIEKDRDGELLAQLRRRIKPLVKRRTKEQVAADLPAKQEQVLEVELHRRHRTIYQRHLQRERQKVLGLINDMDRNRFTILRSLTLLRQLSLHAGLVDDKNHDIPSAKVDALVEQLDDVVGGGHRALVFSQFTGFLEVVRSRLDVAGIDYCYLDGKTRNRSAVIERFKGGSVPVFLISLKAGGFGLNLTEADYCFLLDPWWNPATEAQAVDRTHRIGQTRQVMVYRLIAADTIEQKVMALKARKSQLFSSVMDDGNAFGAGLDADDIRALFA